MPEHALRLQPALTQYFRSFLEKYNTQKWAKLWLCSACLHQHFIFVVDNLIRHLFKLEYRRNKLQNCILVRIFINTWSSLFMP